MCQVRTISDDCCTATKDECAKSQISEDGSTKYSGVIRMCAQTLSCALLLARSKNQRGSHCLSASPHFRTGAPVLHIHPIAIVFGNSCHRLREMVV
jgi:hypothetical protein